MSDEFDDIGLANEARATAQQLFDQATWNANAGNDDLAAMLFERSRMHLAISRRIMTARQQQAAGGRDG